MSFWELGRTALSYFALLFGINFTLKPNAFASLGEFTFYKNFGAINIHKSDFMFCNIVFVDSDLFFLLFFLNNVYSFLLYLH